MKFYLLTLLSILHTTVCAEENPSIEKPAAVISEETEIVNGERFTVVTKNYAWEKTVKVPTTTQDKAACEANVSLQYWQQNDIVKVTATIEEAECASSSGSYTVILRTASDDGEKHTQRHTETWSRSNDEPIEKFHKYSMNGAVDLLRVRLKLPSNGACFCQRSSVDDELVPELNKRDSTIVE